MCREIFIILCVVFRFDVRRDVKYRHIYRSHKKSYIQVKDIQQDLTQSHIHKRSSQTQKSISFKYRDGVEKVTHISHIIISTFIYTEGIIQEIVLGIIKSTNKIKVCGITQTLACTSLTWRLNTRRQINEMLPLPAF